MYCIVDILLLNYFRLLNTGSAFPDNVGVPLITISPSDNISAVVDTSTTIQCIVETYNNLQISDVTLKWIGPDSIVIANSSRITISSTTFNGINEYTSSLQFSYIIGEDEGTYICNVTVLTRTATASVTLDVLQGS